MTPKYITEQQMELIGNTDIHSLVTTISISNIINLFSIGASTEKDIKGKVEPFIHQVQFHRHQGEIVRVWANVDDGAMREVMSSATFRKVKHRLGTTSPTTQLLHVVNGMIIKSEAKWEGRIEINGISANIAFKIFSSSKKWDFLFGKTLLETFKAVHNYESDKITVYGNGGKTTLHNQAHLVA